MKSSAVTMAVSAIMSGNLRKGRTGSRGRRKLNCQKELPVINSKTSPPIVLRVAIVIVQNAISQNAGPPFHLQGHKF
jgi:hypothetical protein